MLVPPLNLCLFTSVKSFIWQVNLALTLYNCEKWPVESIFNIDVLSGAFVVFLSAKFVFCFT